MYQVVANASEIADGVCFRWNDAAAFKTILQFIPVITIPDAVVNLFNPSLKCQLLSFSIACQEIVEVKVKPGQGRGNTNTR